MHKILSTLDCKKEFVKVERTLQDKKGVLRASTFRQAKFIYSEKATRGPGAKNVTTESPGCFNQILTFESQKWSPVATF